jgi:hypothetical protein
MSQPFLATHASIPAGFRAESCFTLDYSRDRMLHAVGQLSEEDVWWRPRPEMNAVGNILLHVCGNMRQWIVCTLTGRLDRRDRPSEFSRREPILKGVLVEKLQTTVEEAKAAIEGASDAELLRTRFVQVGDITGLGAVYHSVAHLEGHAQEVIYATRLRLGERYVFRNQY